MKQAPSRKDVYKMFDEISPTYDRINHILSFGFDPLWRRQLVKHLPQKDSLKILDIASGTADQIITLMEHSDQIDEAYGLDPSTKMLAKAKEKLKDKYYRAKVKLFEGTAETLPFEKESFDLVTISFGIRNVENLEKSFAEIQRVLAPGGRLLILEFSLPENPYIKKAHLYYLRTILPKIGALLSGSRKSYEYLNQTIETFPYGSAFLKLLEKEGFSQLKSYPYMLGAVTLYQADLP